MNNRANQQGLVLFVALVALVVMSLAAVALIRSVDTNSLIVGNLSYRQTSVISSSYGVESMADNIGPRSLIWSQSNHASDGYYAVCSSFDGTGSKCSGSNLTLNGTWQPGTTSKLADGVGITSGVDAYGNTIEYIVERMCTGTIFPLAPSSSNCLLAILNTDNSSKNVLNEPVAGAPAAFTDAPLYRITVKVTGPKNTISYVQAFIS